MVFSFWSGKDSSSSSSSSSSSTTSSSSSNPSPNPSLTPPPPSSDPSPSPLSSSPLFQSPLLKPPSIKTESSTNFSLPNPGRFEDINKEAKGIIGLTEQFDGVRLEFTRGVTPTFLASHLFHIASQNDPPSYNLMSHYVREDAKVILLSRIDTDGSLFGRYQHTLLGDRLVFRLSGQVGQEESATSLETDYKGNDYFLQFKAASGGTYGLSYMQSVSQRLGLGSELWYHHKQGVSALNLGFRYVNDKATIAGTLSSMANMSVSYTHKHNENLSLASELLFALGQTGSFESVCSGGLEYRLTNGFVRLHLDSSSRVSAMIEDKNDPALGYTFSIDVDHRKKAYRFGMGITFNT